jgi:hypothetical protein
MRLDAKPKPLQGCSKTILGGTISSANEHDSPRAALSMNGERLCTCSCDREGPWFIKTSTRNVEITVTPALDSFEGAKAVGPTSYGLGDLGSARFDSATVWCEERPRTTSSTRADAIVLALAPRLRPVPQNSGTCPRLECLASRRSTAATLISDPNCRSSEQMGRQHQRDDATSSVDSCDRDPENALAPGTCSHGGSTLY